MRETLAGRLAHARNALGSHPCTGQFSRAFLRALAGLSANPSSPRALTGAHLLCAFVSVHLCGCRCTLTMCTSSYAPVAGTTAVTPPCAPPLPSPHAGEGDCRPPDRGSPCRSFVVFNWRRSCRRQQRFKKPHVAGQLDAGDFDRHHNVRRRLGNDQRARARKPARWNADRHGRPPHRGAKPASLSADRKVTNASHMTSASVPLS